MSNEELITKAKMHVNSLLQHEPGAKSGVEPNGFSEAEVLETPPALVKIVCKVNEVENIFEFILNAKTGMYIFASHTKKNPGGKSCYLP
ncbi:MAG: hypothetical protein KGJ60_16015 [Verrucomicrobiota bacterium]|nr:hypothetical protein [Verrucomicrobiota bacterium]